jgi:hypothetical protein
MSEDWGAEVYSCGRGQVRATGRTLTADQLGALLKSRVAPIIRDESGQSQITAMLTGGSSTGFDLTAIRQALHSPEPLKDWQIGEALAEALLTATEVCVFPWPSSRDLRDLAASLPGTDLVGLKETSGTECQFQFAFGEVKTSSDATTPPGVMSGRHGLTAQLEDLRDNKPTRDTLFRYLAARASGSDWEPKFQAAARRYLRDSNDVALYGVLVRDTSPAQLDLQARAAKLDSGCPAATGIALFAIYLPATSIKSLAQRIESINAEVRHARN